ncbi:MAG: 50S ribosomal protein L2 [Candidatus Magasanikbacteria bacterium]|jgi:large subunit ribosomal protein L2|nr:50S ribosomal protein L2 [Candidatus Magasanikbacteria bacterium]MBT4314662.1 50S ribosomal protein L2 [Candidatus Magasanikbacteria bacterium]MBT4547082.1 50S ribosomal protein L2 [Candidatus Magasanikbacteria bacterium]MBT6819542.1 50S ribosomal protein L2 [Candidatus Magasanikbacteria bacterium]
MAVKVYKPTTPGRRKSSVQDFSDITKKRPEKSLIAPMKSKAGRNNQGKITVRHRGGGVKKLYRVVDFKRYDLDVEFEVKTIEYDPNRNARIMMVQSEAGKKAYYLAPQGIEVGQKIVCSKEGVEATTGNRMPLEKIPVGLFVYNVELTPGKGGQIVRGAGNGAQLQVIEGKYAQMKLPSGEVRLIQKESFATVGMVSNPDYRLIRWGKAGRRRMLGWRPIVKGKNMNPVDHPHGGGEGHSPIGLRGGPKTKWGKKAMGVKTRKKGKWSDKFVVKGRKSKKR